MEDYRKHIQHTHADLKDRSWCGQEILDWAFVSIDHAAYNSLQKGYLLVCEDCIEKVKRAFDQ